MRRPKSSISAVPAAAPGGVLSKISGLRQQQHVAEARAILEYWARKPTGPLFKAQLGALAADLGMFVLAHDLLSRSLPELEAPSMRWLASLHLANVELFMGRFDLGLPRMASTRTAAGAETMTQLWASDGDNQWFVRNAHRYVWDQPIADRTVMVMAEGGAGDRFDLSRYAKDLKSDGAQTVIFQAEAREVDVLKTNPWIDEVLPAGAFMQRLVEQESALFTILFTLRARYQTHPFFPPRPFPYLAASATQNSLTAAPGVKPRIGLIWKSESAVRQEPFRSIPLKTLEPLLAETSVEWLSLQVGAKTPAEDQLLLRFGVVDLSEEIDTFGDTAGLLSRLDLLISIDTGAAHLAGAMDSKVWLLLCACADSRWANFNGFTPLYPSMRIFRQSELGAWTNVVSDVQQALRRLSPEDDSAGSLEANADKG